MLEIDEVVVGISIDCSGVGRRGVARRRIDWRDRLRFARRRAAKGRIIENRKIFGDRAARRWIEVSILATPRRRSASATIMLASTANASPPPSLSFMQRAITVSNSFRNRSLSRKWPWRFFEKVEWSGTSPSRPKRQNQR